MEIMRSLAAAGKSILFITHKLKEVKEIADVITVIRQGRVVGTAEPTASEAELASMMVGREVEPHGRKVSVQPGRRRSSRFATSSCCDDRGLVAVNGVSLDVRAGEVLALAGVQGNGQTEFVEALVGMRPVESGTITLRGVATSPISRHARGPRRGTGPHPRRPSARRSGVLDVRRRQPGAQHAAARAIRSSWHAQLQRGQRIRRTARPRLRHPHDVHSGSGELPLGRQPAEGDRRSRAVAIRSSS